MELIRSNFDINIRQELPTLYYTHTGIIQTQVQWNLRKRRKGVNVKYESKRKKWQSKYLFHF